MADLAELRARFEAADAASNAIAAEKPAGDTVIEVRPPRAAGIVVVDDGPDQTKYIRLFSDEQNRRLNAARSVSLELALALSRERARLRAESLQG